MTGTRCLLIFSLVLAVLAVGIVHWLMVEATGALDAMFKVAQ